MESIKKSFSYIKILQGSSIAVLTFLFLLGQNLERFFNSKEIIIGWLTIKFIGFEIIVLLLLLMFWSNLLGLIKDVFIKLRKLLYENRFKFIGIISFMVIVFGFIAYNGYYYVKGKIIRYNNFDSEIVVIVNELLKDGDHKRASFYLDACDSILDSYLCQDIQESIENRINEVEYFRELYKVIPMYSNKKFEVLNIIQETSQDVAYYNNLCTQFNNQMEEIELDYSNALTFIIDNDFQSALKNLKKVQRRYPGFGECHIIQDEIKSIKNLNSVTEKKTPYLFNLIKDREWFESVLKQPNIKYCKLK